MLVVDDEPSIVDDVCTAPAHHGFEVARRLGGQRSGIPGPPPAAARRLRFADLELDEDTREVRRGSARIELTATEYRLLHYLFSNPRRALTRAQLRCRCAPGSWRGWWSRLLRRSGLPGGDRAQRPVPDRSTRLPVAAATHRCGSADGQLRIRRLTAASPNTLCS